MAETVSSSGREAVAGKVRAASAGPMTAALRTAAVRSSARSQAERLLEASQREYDRRHPLAADAALPTLTSAPRRAGEGRYPDSPDRVLGWSLARSRVNIPSWIGEGLTSGRTGNDDCTRGSVP